MESARSSRTRVPVTYLFCTGPNPGVVCLAIPRCGCSAPPTDAPFRSALGLGQYTLDARWSSPTPEGSARSSLKMTSSYLKEENRTRVIRPD